MVDILNRPIRIVLGEGGPDTHIYDLETGEEIRAWGLELTVSCEPRKRAELVLKVRPVKGSVIEGKVTGLETI